MFRQFAILCLAVSAVLSAPTDVVPLEKQQPTVIPIIAQSEELEPNGTYKFSYETGNGIKREEVQFDKIVPKLRGQSDGSNEGGEDDGSDKIHVQQGSYSYTAPDGTVITLRYIADENGFQAFGDHLPRAPVPVSVSSSSPDKSGRALKSVDSAEAASVPVSAAKPEPVPETVQSVPEALPESSTADISNEVEPKSDEVAASPVQPGPVETAEQSSTTVASEVLTEVAPTTVVAELSSEVKTKQSDAPLEQSSTTAESSAAEAEESSTAEAEESSTAAAEESSAVPAEEASTVAAAESITAAAEESSTVTAAESNTAAADQSTPTVNVEEPAPTGNAEVPVTNTPVEQESSTRTENELTSNADDNQTSPSAIAKESSVSESEKSATTESSLQPEESASTTVTV